MSDALTLVRAAQAGDRAALAQLVEDYWPQLERFGRMWPPLDGDADDGTQLAALAFLRAVETFDPTQAQFGTWMERVVRTQLWNARRPPRSARVIPINETGFEWLCETELGVTVGTGPPAPLSPEGTCLAAVGHDDLVQLLHHVLSPAERRALLGHVAGISHQDMARQLKRSPHAVRHLLQRSRRKLQQALGAWASTG
jgi:RNA polymerase sigma factor (sigma-70 family)